MNSGIKIWMVNNKTLIHMKRNLLIFLLSISNYFAIAQNFEDLSFGTDSTFEAITWNIEWFPKNGQTTVDYVIDIIEVLDADLLAIQEVDDIDAFEEMVSGLDDYEGYLESAWFAGLAYIYKSGIVQIDDIYEIYTTSPYWSPFPRSPVVMEMDFMGQRIILINNHFKCCGDGILNLNDPGDEETRRYNASSLLKEYIDTFFPDKKVIVLGDLNDDLADDPANNVFQQIIDDDENYLFADYEIAFGGNSGWSYPTWPSHLDHILITNELFDEFYSDATVIKTIKIDNHLPGGWYEYEQNISDHRPVAIKFVVQENLSTNDCQIVKPFFINFPNPFKSTTTFSFNAPDETTELTIYDLNGKPVFSENIPAGVSSIRWNAEQFRRGIYLVRLSQGETRIASKRVVLIK